MPAGVCVGGEGGGWVDVSELCVLGALPFVLIRHGRRLQMKPVRISVCVGLLWLAAQVLTDMIRESPMEDYSRGWSKILLTVTHFATVALLIRQSQRRFILYGAGLALGGVLTFYIAPTFADYAEKYPWKFGLGPPITILVCLIAGILAQRRR